MAGELEYIINVLAPQVGVRLWELLIAVTRNPDMIWMVTPLVIITVLMTFYFGRYKEEELGWNTAVGNSVVLLFVSIDLLRYLYNFGDVPSILNYQFHWIKTLIAIGIILEGILLLFTNFLHFLPKKIAFFISSALPVNLQAYIAIAIVYTNVKFDWITLLAAIVLFFVLLIFFQFLKFLETLVLDSINEAKKQEKEEEHKKAEQLVKEKEKEEITKTAAEVPEKKENVEEEIQEN